MYSKQIALNFKDKITINYNKELIRGDCDDFNLLLMKQMIYAHGIFTTCYHKTNDFKYYLVFKSLLPA